MKITKWWWALIWGAAALLGSELGSEQGLSNPFNFGQAIGIVIGALLMRWHIKSINS